MKILHPQIEVRLIKAFARQLLVEGSSMARRYGGIDGIDLRPYLGENGGVSISKSVREPAGGFRITLTDQAHPTALDSIYALVEPMDMVEIRMAHDMSLYPGKAQPPVVMRGFVSSVSRSRVMANGKPIRTVEIAGQDFGKILEIFQIFYLKGSLVSDQLLTGFNFFQKWADAQSARVMPANEFVSTIIVENIINDYLKKMTSLARGESVGATVISSWKVTSSIKGAISPFVLNSFVDVSLYQMLATLLDIGPFNELYVEDLEDGVQLVVRPAPFLDVDGKPLQGNTATPFYLYSDDIVADGRTRSDAGVANYFWVDNSTYFLAQNGLADLLALGGDTKDYILFDYLNSTSSRYGIRSMNVVSNLAPEEYLNSDAQMADEVPGQTDALTGWIAERRKLLALMNRDNVLFESGSIRSKGDERVKAGMQLHVVHGQAVESTAYITRVDHSFTPFQGFFTTLTVERGTDYVERAKASTSQYQVEIDAKGIR